jgi:hypothetical protein
MLSNLILAGSFAVSIQLIGAIYQTDGKKPHAYLLV